MKEKMIKRQPTTESHLPLAGKQKATGKSGFTMIELLVVIVVMGIILAFSIPAINTGKLRFDQAVDGVDAKLKFARQEAMTKGINYGVDWNANALWIFRDNNGNITLDAGEPSDTVKFGTGITLTSPAAGPIDFNLDGTVTQGAALGLVSPTQKDTVWFAITIAGFIYKNQ